MNSTTLLGLLHRMPVSCPPVLTRACPNMAIDHSCYKWTRPVAKRTWVEEPADKQHSMKVEGCQWGIVTCHIANDHATPVGRTRPGKAGDPAINITATGPSGIPARLVILAMAPWKPTMPFVSLWGMGRQERKEGSVHFEIAAEDAMITQAQAWCCPAWPLNFSHLIVHGVPVHSFSSQLYSSFPPFGKCVKDEHFSQLSRGSRQRRHVV